MWARAGKEGPRLAWLPLQRVWGSLCSGECMRPVALTVPSLSLLSLALLLLPAICGHWGHGGSKGCSVGCCQSVRSLQEPLVHSQRPCTVPSIALAKLQSHSWELVWVHVP